MPEKELRELKEMLFDLILGIDQWKKDFSKVPDLLYKGHLLLMKQAASSGTVVPNNLYDLLNVLKQPAKEWGIDRINDVYSPDAALIEDAIGITPEAEDFLEGYEYPLEDDQRAMRNVLNYCREHNLDDEYRLIRTFLSSPQHAVLSHFDLNIFLHSKLADKKLRQLVEQCYEEMPQTIDNYRKCPHCGWTLEYRNGFWRCNKEDVCSYLSDFDHVSEFRFIANDDFVRQTPGIQRYVLLPGIHELSLAAQLQEKGYDVELYPNIDEFDLRIIGDPTIIDIDVKDYKDPRQLANYFNQLSEKGMAKYHEKSYIVVPDYRMQASSAYVDLFKSRLDNGVNITLLQGREFVGKLKEAKL